MMKKILFITGTRAEFGKLKPLIREVHNSPQFEECIFITGMHMLNKFGGTYREVLNEYVEITKDKARFFTNIHMFLNQQLGESHDTVLANTIVGLTRLISDFFPDMIVVHGDRVEALAGAIVGAMRNIRVVHIEGGEVSGTIDESIRHSITKLSHIHLTANNDTLRRLIQLGEERERIFILGSPDVEMLTSDNLPEIEIVKSHYEIEFNQWGICLFHPVSTEHEQIAAQSQELVKAMIESRRNYIVIYPNNDLGSEHIFKAYELLEKLEKFKILPSMKFEYFLSLLKHCNFIIGNSSAGVREAPAVGVPAVNIGTRQNRRSCNPNIINCGYSQSEIVKAVSAALNSENKHLTEAEFGNVDSVGVFMEVLNDPKIWAMPIQKNFLDTELSDGHDVL